ncbi:uncharacterized protein FIBRA_05048 [Fibroporia radiculosa]|uniref:Uncharacterized protein n=1 Tax=Fibroporia radiculosa TaxID=599839 RepID=J4G8F2_9APHY|nr:uncharacterized protein FIBRA_05048 [Fibroporia radiculosa]CCM02933.1 predicted protein [Fibroporia radiculosa]
MDPINSRDNLFSRGPSPPPSQQPFQLPPSQPSDQHVSPAPSHLDPPPAPSTTQLDNLFNTLNAPSVSHVSPQPSHTSSNIYLPSQEHTNSRHASPASVNAGSVSSSMSAPTNPTVERQNALLTLLGSVSAPVASIQLPPVGGAAPQQVPTPPGSAPRNTMSNNETQGKLLLEQLMSG